MEKEEENIHSNTDKTNIHHAMFSPSNMNHRMVSIARYLKDHLVPTPLP